MRLRRSLKMMRLIMSLRLRTRLMMRLRLRRRPMMSPRLRRSLRMKRLRRKRR